ncbi:alpha/beta fold hydrolase [Nocardia sp. NPDC052112]|uniref:alpha/beta hydrolase n=1 Tax=Nocardia sp. NPDC052112 TaxID=3155646 RepID=UPI00342B57AC
MEQRTDIRIPVEGEELHAWWYPPHDVNGPAPCVVLAHGFGGIKQMRLWAYAEQFSEAGFGALVFDYRHFGESTGQPRNLLDLGKQFSDWNAAITAARARPDVDPDRVAVWGSSMSGGMVMMVAARDARIAAGRREIDPHYVGQSHTALGCRKHPNTTHRPTSDHYRR